MLNKVTATWSAYTHTHTLTCRHTYSFLILTDLLSENVKKKDPNLFTCSVCSKMFRYPSQLTQHERCHYGEKPYCKMCDRKFTNMGNLTVHIKIHSREKPFCCEICGKAFRNIHHLDCHSLVHRTKS